MQAISTPGESFDLVIANHMLYHVPDIHRGIREIQRVLKPGGLLFAATNGREHLRELDDLLSERLPGYPQSSTEMRRFSLEVAPGIVGEHFARVEVRRYESNLVVTEADPLISYIRSMWGVIESANKAVTTNLENHLRERISREGQFLITQSVGLVIAGK